MQQELAAEPLWYRVQLERQTLKDLRRRTNVHGLIYFGSYLVLTVLFASLTVADVLPVWARVICFLLFANVFCFGEAILHETHHRTPFRSSWLNEAVHYFVGVLMLKEPLRDRWCMPRTILTPATRASTRRSSSSLRRRCAIS